ncbi:hypothetical protein C1645_824678, partial [Glomus cerebriforme]
INVQELREKLKKGELPLKKEHINIIIAGIIRLLRLGYDKFRVENDRKLINKYLKHRDLLDDELIIKLNELYDETEIEKRLKQLKNLIESIEVNITDGELLRLIKKNIKEILDEYLRKQIGIKENTKEEKNDIDNSEKIGEILSPGEYEIWDENIENINENEIEDELQNAINTGVARILERAVGLADGTLNNVLRPGETIADRIANAGNETGIVNMPPFSGRKDEDVND